MLSLNDLSDKRKNDSKSVRSACSFESGRKISDSTWNRWRKFCRIPLGARLLSERETFILLIYSRLHRQGKIRKMSYFGLILECNKILRNPDSVSILGEFESIFDGNIKGSDIPRYVHSQTGYFPSIKTLYRWGSEYRCCPKFSINGDYSQIQARAFCSLARSIRDNISRNDKAIAV